jgi:uncharacterized protein (TIGR02246 family)
MHRKTLFASAVSAFVVFALNFAIAVPADSAESQIISQIDRYCSAVGEHDAEALSMLFTEDASYVTGGTTLKGRKQIHDWLVQGFKGVPKSKVTKTIDSLKFTDASHAVASVTFSYDFNGTIVRRGYIRDYVKQNNGGWLIQANQSKGSSK